VVVLFAAGVAVTQRLAFNSWGSAVPLVGTYCATLALVGAVEVWVRVFPRARVLPMPTPEPAAWLWVAGSLLVVGTFVIAFWRFAEPRAVQAIASTTPVFGSPVLTSRLIDVAYGGGLFTVVALVFFGFRWRGRWGSAFRFQVWDAGLLLWLLGVDAAVVVLADGVHGSHVVQGAPIVFFGWVTPLVYSAQLLVNGLPEETFFRGFLLREFMSILHNNTLLSVWIAAILFDSFHIPSWIFGHGLLWNKPWWMIALECVFPNQPTGAFFGYLFLRSKSLVPGIGLHTILTFIGFIP